MKILKLYPFEPLRKDESLVVKASLKLFTTAWYVFLHHFQPRHKASFCAHLPLLLPLGRALIDKDVSIPPETFRKHVDTSLTYINRALKQMSRLFLVEDLVDSLKVSTSSLQSLSTVNLSF